MSAVLLNPARPVDEVREALVKQLTDEAGPEPQQTDFVEFNQRRKLGITTTLEVRDYERRRAYDTLRQKYGLIPPRLTVAEEHLLAGERLHLAKNPHYWEEWYAKQAA